jgi:hypothetical protein
MALTRASSSASAKGLTRHGGQKQHRRFGTFGAQVTHDLQAIHAGQHAVQDKRGIVPRPGARQAHAAIRHGIDLVTGGGQGL